MKMNRGVLSRTSHGGSYCNSAVSDLSYHSSNDDDGYNSDDDDDEDGGGDSVGPLPSLTKRKKSFSLKRQSRRHGAEHQVDRKINWHSRRLPYRLPDALFLPPTPVPTPFSPSSSTLHVDSAATAPLRKRKYCWRGATFLVLAQIILHGTKWSLKASVLIHPRRRRRRFNSTLYTATIRCNEDFRR